MKKTLPGLLEKHLSLWQGQGIVDGGTVERMREASREMLRDRQSGVLKTAGTIFGVLLLLSGLIMLIAENWEAIPRLGKFSGWLVVFGAMLAAWVRVDSVEGGRKFAGEAVSLCCGVWILAGVALMGQMFHLQSRFSDGFWLWFGLLLPLLWVRPSGSLQLLAMVAAAVALGGEMEEMFHRLSWFWLYSFTGPVVSAGIVAWISRRDLGWVRGVVTTAFMVPAFIGLLFFGMIEESWSWREAVELVTKSPKMLWMLLPLAVVGAMRPGIVLTPVFKRSTASWLLTGACVPWMIILLAGSHPGDGARWLVLVTAWIVQVGMAFFVIRDGAEAFSRFWMNTGYLMMFIVIVCRYFDFFHRFGFMNSGFGFLISGLFILGLIWGMGKSRIHLIGREEQK